MITLSSTLAAQAPDQRFLFEPPLSLDLYLQVPQDSQLSADKITLGRKLFFDPFLSADPSIACATCHDPTLAFTDGKAISVGVFGRTGTRSIPTLINRTYGKAFFLGWTDQDAG